ncbi:hypothetical protein NUW58_g3910 [Xylaria curta]|uniref:Uncharacterized protein n=1 Tax=Xylaria curta TaxID=42375 RepID=A0ACC1PA81_9PEZI|nr:hypothetical protein NUW58_g3910 [Xylaria curta]
MGRGAVSAAIRFLCHVPFGYYAFAGVNHFTFIRDHSDVLLTPPLGPRIFVGEVFSGPIGVIGFFWNFFLWLPTMDSKGSGLVLLGIVDAIFTGFLIIALSIEASFIGFTSAQCAQLRPGAAPTSNLIYFQRVAEIEFEEKNIGEETCRGYYAKWYVGLVVAILYALSAFANITLGASSRGSDRYNDYRDYIRPFWRSSTSPVEYFKRGLVDLAYDLMPTRMQYYLSFANRYIEHSFRRQRSKMSQKAQKAYALLPWRARSSKGKESGLSTVLSQEVLERMSPHLHYVDIVSLSLTSKAIRKAVFQQHGDSTVDKEQLRYYSCQGSKKYDCWACGIQICDPVDAVREFICFVPHVALRRSVLRMLL